MSSHPPSSLWLFFFKAQTSKDKRPRLSLQLRILFSLQECDCCYVDMLVCAVVLCYPGEREREKICVCRECVLDLKSDKLSLENSRSLTQQKRTQVSETCCHADKWQVFNETKRLRLTLPCFPITAHLPAPPFWYDILVDGSKGVGGVGGARRTPIWAELRHAGTWRLCDVALNLNRQQVQNL